MFGASGGSGGSGGAGGGSVGGGPASHPSMGRGGGRHPSMESPSAKSSGGAQMYVAAGTKSLEATSSILMDVLKRRKDSKMREMEHQRGIRKAAFGRETGVADIRDKGTQRGVGMALRALPG